GFPGNDQQLVVDRFGDEFAARARGRVWEHVEGAARLGDFVARFQRFVKAIAFAAVIGDMGRKIIVPGDQAGVLHYAGGANVGELLKLGHFFNNGSRTVGVGEPPAGHAVGLAEAVEDQDIVIELGGAAKTTVIAVGAVNLVAQEQDAALLGQKSQVAKLLAGIKHAGRI